MKNAKSAIIIVSHGNLANELKNTVEMICGVSDNIFTLTLDVADDIVMFKQELISFNNKLSKFDHIYVFSDLLGGSVNRLVYEQFVNDDRYSLISGVNVAMLIAVLFEEAVNVEDIVNKGQLGIKDLKKIK